MGTKTELLERIRKAEEDGSPLTLLIVTRNQYASLLEGSHISKIVTQQGTINKFYDIEIEVVGSVNAAPEQDIYGTSPGRPSGGITSFFGMDVINNTVIADIDHARSRLNVISTPNGPTELLMDHFPVTELNNRSQRIAGYIDEASNITERIWENPGGNTQSSS